MARRFKKWPGYTGNTEDPTICPGADKVIEKLRENSHVPPVVFFSEWIDMWSMGDLLPTLGNQRTRVVYGNRFQVSLHRPPVKVARHIIGRALTQECKWLRAHVREAEDAWEPLIPSSIILVAREVFARSTSDDEIEASLQQVPAWITK